MAEFAEASPNAAVSLLARRIPIPFKPLADGLSHNVLLRVGPLALQPSFKSYLEQAFRQAGLHADRQRD